MSVAYLIARTVSDTFIYSTLKNAVENAPMECFGEGEYTPIDIIEPCPATAYYDITYQVNTKSFPAGCYQVDLQIYPLSVDNEDENPVVTTEDIEYIKGLQS